MSFDEKMWSTRALPKSSRMVCSGLLKTCAMPLKSGAPAAAMGQRFSSGCTLGTAAARDASVGNERRRGLVQVLAQAFVVGEEKVLSFCESGRRATPPNWLRWNGGAEPWSK